MKFIVILLLAFAAVSFCKKDNGLKGVYSGGWAGQKMSQLQIRQAIFQGQSGWKMFGVPVIGDYTSYPQRTFFNISRSPTPTFVAATSAITTTNVAKKGTYVDGANTLDNYYQKVMTSSNFAVMQNTNNDLADWGHMMTTSRTLKVQRTNYYMCAHQQWTAAITSTDFRYVSKGCAEWSISEYNENQSGMNKSITIGSFGTVHLYFNYIHNTGNSKIPKYLTEVTINKITAYTNPTGNKYTTKTFKVSMGNVMATLTGNMGYSWSTGFALSTGAITTLSPQAVEVVSATDYELYVQLLEQVPSTGGVGVSSVAVWSAGQSGLTTATINTALNFCDLDNVLLQSGAFEIDMNVKCSSGYIVKFALAMVAMVAGLFML